MKKVPNRYRMDQYVCANSLRDDMRRLLQSGDRSDAVLETADRSVQLRAHTDVIAVRCKAIRSLVLTFLSAKGDGTRPDTDTLIVPLRLVSQAALEQVAQYIYTGKIDLEDALLYDICVLSAHLGVPSLEQHVFCYLGDSEHSSLVPRILDQAFNDEQPARSLIARLTQSLSDNCSQILKSAHLGQVSLLTMQHMVKQESLSASESEIWEALVTWACYVCGISPKGVATMTTAEREKVSEHLSTFCRPGYVRILNFNAEFFSTEVEPLGVFSRSESLLKYRFDATVGDFPFDCAFPKDRYSFLARVRQRSMSFESGRHPHPRGAYSKVKVEMPRWVSEMEVTFDERTALGRYADLEFFMDEEGSIRLFSLRASQNESTLERSAYFTASVRRPLAPQVPEPLQITGNVFWFTFYAPKNIGDLAWGYKFLVSVLR